MSGNAPVSTEQTSIAMAMDGDGVDDGAMEFWRNEEASAVTPSMPSQADAEIYSNRAEPIGEPERFDAYPDGSAFAHHAPFRPRKNPARRWWLVAIAVAALAVLTGGAVAHYGTSTIAGWLGIPIGQTGSLLKFSNLSNERRISGQGRQLIQVSGEIVNPTDSEQYVPDIVVDIEDGQKRKIYSWSFDPPARRIGPGGKLPFTSASAAPQNNATKIGLSFKAPARD